MRIAGALALAACVAAAGSTGCVSKKTYRTDSERDAARMDSMEDSIEVSQQRISQISDETDAKVASVDQKSGKAQQTGDQAMGLAQDANAAADRAAKGKLLWDVKLSDDRVKFSFNGTDVPTPVAGLLDDLAQKVKSYGKAVFLEIEGHTDGVGSEDYNRQLGEKRAMAVRDYLATKGGIPLHAMNVISYGESKPEADNGTAEGRAKNRRVVVRVLE